MSGMLDELRQAPHVPGEALAERRVEEALERNVQPRERTPEIIEERSIGRAAAIQAICCPCCFSRRMKKPTAR